MAEELSSIVPLQVGDIAPDYELRSTEGKPVSVRESATSHEALVLVFLRGLR